MKLNINFLTITPAPITEVAAIIKKTDLLEEGKLKKTLKGVYKRLKNSFANGSLREYTLLRQIEQLRNVFVMLIKISFNDLSNRLITGYHWWW